MPKFPAASAAVLLLLALGATACKKAEAPADTGDGAAATPAATAPAATPAPGATAAAGSGDGDTKYQCSSGIVPVTYKSGTATLKLKDKVIELKADSANADRFIGTGVEWWVNGRGQGGTANLYALTPEGEPGDVLEGCVENPQA